MKNQAVKVSHETLDDLKWLEIEVSGVPLKTNEQKLQHLIWYYKSYKNWNRKDN